VDFYHKKHIDDYLFVELQNELIKKCDAIPKSSCHANQESVAVTSLGLVKKRIPSYVNHYFKLIKSYGAFATETILLT
jgi:hypothetical protein